VPHDFEEGSMPRRELDPNVKNDLGDETGDESSPRPDENVADEIGDEVGVTYEEGEPMHTVDKVVARDEHRWELDPASSEDFDERSRLDPATDD
jgi:hypothetical protein